MTISDLCFLASVLLVAILVVRVALLAVRRRWPGVRRAAGVLGGFLVLYVAVLAGSGMVRPRRFFAAGERRCFDDWCVTAIGAAAVEAGVAGPCGAGGAGREWVATLEVSSDAKRVRQRAPDARVELEDAAGRRYRPCAGTGPRQLTDELGPGDSFRLAVPFRLPADAAPAGVVVHHGDVPGVAIIGADQGWLHSPALQRLSK